MGKIYIGFDPGKATGYAAFQDAQLIESQVIYGGFEGFEEWWGANIDHGPISLADSIVVERYIPLEGFRGIDQTYSLEIQGAIRALASAPVTLQQRSDKATLFNQVFDGDKGQQERFAWFRERGLHFYTPHEMDAATHVLVARKRARDMKFWRRYWA